MHQTKNHRHVGRSWMVETTSRPRGIVQNLQQPSDAQGALRQGANIVSGGLQTDVATPSETRYERMRRRQRENAGS